jgi:hypothetical protein
MVKKNSGSGGGGGGGGSLAESCKFCLKNNIDNSTDHTDDKCFFRQAMYCSQCAKYGHPTTDCPVKNASWATAPIYLEQLIPTEDLKIHNICSKTPLVGGPLSEGTLRDLQNRTSSGSSSGGGSNETTRCDPHDNRLIELVYDDYIIKQFLKNNGYSNITDNFKKNLKLIERFENERGVVISFIPGNPEEIISSTSKKANVPFEQKKKK